jgi:hypothetical protein
MKEIEIRVDGRLRCRTSAENIELAELYFRQHGFDAPAAARALAQDDGGGKTHTVYEWLAIVHEAKAQLDRELDFRGR